MMKCILMNKNTEVLIAEYDDAVKACVNYFKTTL